MSEAAQTLGGYRLGRRLGAGGMGVVYEGVHEATGARRAIKTLRAGDSELMLRFEREGQALAKVDHPNVVHVHSLGRESGLLYLVMDLAEGGSLADRLRLGPLPLREGATLVRDLAQGLAHVHASGILHRDLKPDNVLFDSKGTPRLSDFGLARIAKEGSLTATGTVMGTPAYMAPEQADGQVVDELADVYGLGAILYEVLTGSPPFRGTGALAVLNEVLHREPTPPRSLRPEIQPALEAVCLRALDKDPAKRQPSAAAFAEELATWESAARQPALSLAQALGVGAVLGVLALLAGALGLALWPTPPTPPAPRPTAVRATAPPPEATPAPLGWRHVPAPEGQPWPAPREGHERAMAWIPGTGVVLFGGWDYRTVFDDLWVWNGKRWRELPRSEPWPEGRYAHAMTYDAARERLVLYGGIGMEGGRGGKLLKGQIWEWGEGGWRIVSTPVMPSRRFWHVMVDDPRGEGVYLFGGKTAEGYGWADLWRWDGRRFLAQPQADESRVPAARGQCGIAFDAARGLVVVYGGQRGVEGTGDAAYGDLWEWDGSGWREAYQGKRRGPGARTALGMVYARDRVVVFGGRRDDGQRPVDLWSRDGARWAELETAGPPSGRIWHGMVYDGDRDVIVVFGGNVEDKVSAELWELDLKLLR